jgi:hypothetical protein
MIPSTSDLKFYGKILFGVAAAVFFLSRVVPGIGMRVGLRPNPLPFMPSIPLLNPVMRSAAQPDNADGGLTAVNSAKAALA